VFFIGSIAETNRAPFDLAEAESELVSGFMTEHSAVIFVFFFLAEYASIVLICILNSILFLGGYLFDFNYYLYPYFYLLQFIQGDRYMYLTENETNFNVIDFDNYSLISVTIIYGIIIGFKACSMIFVFIWARASFPRIRYDQLMSYC
jgi:NADH-ubiquinone oxidoreductase chain 1